MNLQAVNSNCARAIVYCRSEARDNKKLQHQGRSILAYAETQGYTVKETFMESGKMESLTYNSLRLRAKYREFDVLLISELDALGNSPIEITNEINYLVENSIKIISLKEGELNADTLPTLFRKGFRFVK